MAAAARRQRSAPASTEASPAAATAAAATAQPAAPNPYALSDPNAMANVLALIAPHPPEEVPEGVYFTAAAYGNHPSLPSSPAPRAFRSPRAGRDGAAAGVGRV